MKKGRDYIGVFATGMCHDGQGNFLLAKRSEKCRDECGRWNFGGGGIELGETAAEAFKREITEEYGTTPFNVEQLSVQELFREENGEKLQWVAFFFVAEVDRSKVINAEPDSHTEIGWFTLDNLPKPMVADFEKHFVNYSKE